MTEARIALVTGAAQGIGAAVAERLVTLGTRTIVLVDRDQAGLANVAALTAFLVSPGAAMMTGVIIDLDQYVAGTVDNNPGAG